MEDEFGYHLLALHCISGLGTKRIRALLRQFSTPKDALYASEKALEEAEGISTKLACQIYSQQQQALQQAQTEMNWLARHQGRFLHFQHPSWPTALHNVPQAPLGFFLLGKLPKKAGIAIVGTRACSSYGKTQAARFASALANAGMPIVSGLARGIDACAHKATLEAGGQTIAAIGSGLNAIYPTEHEPLAEQIIAANGAILSEFPHNTQPRAEYFPRRNLLIAALSQGTLVIESATKGGSLITARLAAELGRETWALPGQVDRPAAQGCLQLIRDGATLVTSAQDILEDLQWSQAQTAEFLPEKQPANSTAINTSTANSSAPAHLAPELALLWNILHQHGELSLDEITQHSKLSSSAVSSQLLQLELLGNIQSLPGNRFALSSFR